MIFIMLTFILTMILVFQSDSNQSIFSRTSDVVYFYEKFSIHPGVFVSLCVPTNYKLIIATLAFLPVQLRYTSFSCDCEFESA